MRVKRQLKNGTTLFYGGKMRYVVFRMTMYSAYSVHGDKSALGAVRWARNKWCDNGNRYVVMDTVNGDLIAAYPTHRARELFERETDRQFEDAEAV
jgi:hypothetical protein